ncbi:MAG: SdiA-regulated domain-containing protein [Reichenbachiella sp.]
MKQALTFTLVLFFNSYSYGQSIKHSELELKELVQMTRMDDRQFDLSGIVEVDGKHYVIADKTWNHFIYEIAFTDTSFFVKNSIPITVDDKLDLEAIDYCAPNFYLSNECVGKHYQVSKEGGQLTSIDIDYSTNSHHPATWENAGWEGLAIDCENNIAYTLKERQPRIIFKIDLNTLEILDEFNIPETESNDFADAKFEKGFLYVLERNGNFITKIDIANKKVVDKVYYTHIASHPKGKLYSDEKYGMAEALLLKEDEIWIGLDNNDHEASQYGQDSFGIKGKGPVIIKFKRPKEF